MSLARHDNVARVGSPTAPENDSFHAAGGRAFRLRRAAGRGRDSVFAAVLYGGLVFALIAVKTFHAMHAMPSLAH
jgi:hypothetical protein